MLKSGLSFRILFFDNDVHFGQKERMADLFYSFSLWEKTRLLVRLLILELLQSSPV